MLMLLKQNGGGWRVAGGGWRVAGGGWRVAGGGWRVAGGGWRVAQNVTSVMTRQVLSFLIDMYTKTPINLSLCQIPSIATTKKTTVTSLPKKIV